MKQKDIALIIAVIFVSAVFSLFLSKALFGSAKTRGKQAEVVSPISANFPAPDGKYFNANSIDPAQVIQIGNNSNPAPFQQQSSP